MEEVILEDGKVLPYGSDSEFMFEESIRALAGQW